MIGRALDGEIECNLQSIAPRGRDQLAEVVGRSELRVDRVVTAFLTADGIRAAGIVGCGRQRIVAAFAIGSAARMDRRKTEKVKSHPSVVRTSADDGVE